MENYFDYSKYNPVKLDIGSGNLITREEGRGLSCELPLDEWIHLDIQDGKHVEIIADFANIPLPDNSVDEIFIGDVIEHIPIYRIDTVLKEWYRVLKTNGILRGRTPNLDRCIRDYAENKITLEEALSAIYAGSEEYQVHYCTYTPESLTELLNKYGFTNIDLSDSPGPKDRSWWLVFKSIKK